MFHGHGNGPANMTGGIFWFLYFCGSLVVAYFAMKIAAGRRESREKANKALERRLKAGKQ